MNIKQSIDQLISDGECEIDGMKLYTEEGSDEPGFQIVGFTDPNKISSLTKEKALTELDQVIIKFNSLCKEDARLIQIQNANKPSVFSLAYFYGMGGVGVVEKIGNSINWLMELK